MLKSLSASKMLNFKYFSKIINDKSFVITLSKTSQNFIKLRLLISKIFVKVRLTPFGFVSSSKDHFGLCAMASKLVILF